MEPKRRTTPAKLDAAAAAFALPRTVVLRQTGRGLRRVAGRKEPTLRDAMQRVQQAADSREKLKAASEVKQIREQIRVAIAKILNNQFSDASRRSDNQDRPIGRHAAL